MSRDPGVPSRMGSCRRSERPDPPATLAYHWERAGEPLHAIGHHVAAADAAEAVSALIEALGHIDAAVRLAEGLGPGIDQSALVLRRAMLHDHLGNAAAAREDAERVLAAARSRRDQHLELRALEELGSILAGAVDYRAATPLFDEALHLAEVSGDRTELVRCHARLSIAWTRSRARSRGGRCAQTGRAPDRRSRFCGTSRRSSAGLRRATRRPLVRAGVRARAWTDRDLARAVGHGPIAPRTWIRAEPRGSRRGEHAGLPGHASVVG